jgi:pimeloyl-ACP methyl ester carboxylesterase
MAFAHADGDCDKFRASLPSDWQQGVLNVPEDPAQPNGQQIKIFYYGKINLNSVPTVYFNGGPGSSSHSDYQALTRRQALFDPYKEVSMIFIDQRGNGCSSGYPQGSDIATLQRLSHYGSRGIVADAEAVRLQVWGNRPWIAAGQSYGGYIVHRYVTLYPQSLTAAISQQDVLTSDGYFRIKTRIASQARVLQDYLGEYPDDQDRLSRLHDYLQPTTCFYSPVDATAKICGLGVLNPFTDLIGFTDNWLSIHQWIGLMAPAGEISEPSINRFLAIYGFGTGNPNNLKGWAGAVIDYVDRNVPPEDTTHCEQIRTDLATTGINLDQVYINECMTALQYPRATQNDSSVWQSQLTTDPLTIANLTSVLQSNPALPFYLYSGEKDPFVPVAEFAEELAAIGKLANVHYTDYPDTGHDGSYEEPQTWLDWEKLSTVSN